jgi:hypothetical protein
LSRPAASPSAPPDLAEKRAAAVRYARPAADDPAGTLAKSDVGLGGPGLDAAHHDVNIGTGYVGYHKAAEQGNDVVVDIPAIGLDAARVLMRLRILCEVALGERLDCRSLAFLFAIARWVSAIADRHEQAPRSLASLFKAVCAAGPDRIPALTSPAAVLYQIGFGAGRLQPDAEPWQSIIPEEAF